MRYTLLGPLLALLLVGCSTGAAQTVPTPTVTPWIVTAKRLSAIDNIILTVEYTTPTGALTTWAVTVGPGPGADTAIAPMQDCWTSAKVGSPIPDCMR